MTIKDKVAIITGASSGIGMGCARVLSEAGMKLLLTGRRHDALESLARELLGEAHVHPGDIIDPDLPQQLLDTAVERFGSCDVVLNNAGIMIVGSAPDMDVEAMCRMVRVNVEAAFRLAVLAMRHFLQQDSGYLINTSSILGTKVRQTTGALDDEQLGLDRLGSLPHQLDRPGLERLGVLPVHQHVQIFQVRPALFAQVEDA